jgi:hypothetical protein
MDDEMQLTEWEEFLLTWMMAWITTLVLGAFIAVAFTSVILFSWWALSATVLTLVRIVLKWASYR